MAGGTVDFGPPPKPQGVDFGPPPAHAQAVDFGPPPSKPRPITDIPVLGPRYVGPGATFRPDALAAYKPPVPQSSVRAASALGAANQIPAPVTPADKLLGGDSGYPLVDLATNELFGRDQSPLSRAANLAPPVFLARQGAQAGQELGRGQYGQGLARLGVNAAMGLAGEASGPLLRRAGTEAAPAVAEAAAPAEAAATVPVRKTLTQMSPSELVDRAAATGYPDLSRGTNGVEIPLEERASVYANTPMSPSEMVEQAVQAGLKDTSRGTRPVAADATAVAPPLYHETSPESAVAMGTAFTDLRGIHVTPHQELALGQGGKGAVVEFGNPDALTTERVARPGAGFVGENPDQRVLAGPPTGQQIIRSITFKPGANVRPYLARRLANMGWTAQRDATGATRFANPHFVEPASAPANAVDFGAPPAATEAPPPGTVTGEEANPQELQEMFSGPGIPTKVRKSLGQFYRGGFVDARPLLDQPEDQPLKGEMNRVGAAGTYGDALATYGGNSVRAAVSDPAKIPQIEARINAANMTARADARQKAADLATDAATKAQLTQEASNLRGHAAYYDALAG